MEGKSRSARLEDRWVHGRFHRRRMKTERSASRTEIGAFENRWRAAQIFGDRRALEFHSIRGTRSQLNAVPRRDCTSASVSAATLPRVERLARRRRGECRSLEVKDTLLREVSATFRERPPSRIRDCYVTSPLTSRRACSLLFRSASRRCRASIRQEICLRSSQRLASESRRDHRISSPQWTILRRSSLDKRRRKVV